MPAAKWVPYLTRPRHRIIIPLALIYDALSIIDSVAQTCFK